MPAHCGFSTAGWASFMRAARLAVLPRVFCGSILRPAVVAAAESDCLIYNDPLGYADLILNGDPEKYLKNVAWSHGSEI